MIALMSPTFADIESSVALRRGVLVASVTMAVLALAAAFAGPRDIVVVPSLLPLIAGALIGVAGACSIALFAEFAHTRRVWLLLVAAMYFATAALTVPYVVIVRPLDTGRAPIAHVGHTAVFIAILWELAVPIVVSIAVRSMSAGATIRAMPPARAIAATVAVTVACACAATVAAVNGGPNLESFATRALAPPFGAVALAVIGGLNAATLIALYRRTRLATAITAWLFLAVVASAIDAGIGVVGPHGALGWYIATVLVLAPPAVMLAGIGMEMDRLRTRLAETYETLRVTRDRERHLAQERFHFLARHDEATQLPNRLSLDERLAELGAANPLEPHAVLFVSLDRMDDVVERHGHAARDAVVAAAAVRLREVTREGDTVARFGGSDFVVLAPLAARREATELAHAVRRRLAAAFSGAHDSISIGTSIGVAMFPSDNASPSAVLEYADAASRRAERAGGSAVCIYTEETFGELRSRRRLQEDLGAALLRDQFALHFQPIVDLRSGEVVKAEALLRWIHPQRGMISPAEFIPLAEQSNLMQLIGYWVIEEAVRCAKAWERAGDRLCIAVNVSARQLDDAGFLPHLRRTIEAAQTDPELLELEITESAAMTDASAAEATLRECRALGLSISIDDFGTYYSSLTYLKRLPVDAVKIDRSFVQGLPFVRNDAAIVSAILGLTEALGRISVAEGIENEEQREWLLRAGCRLGQGYLFGRPVPAAEFARRERAHGAGECVSRPS